MVCGENLAGGKDQVKTSKDGTETTRIYAKDVEVTQSIYATDSETVNEPGIYEAEGDTEANKEIMDQINEYKKEGYLTQRLEQILAKEPAAIWDKLVEFQSDIEKLQDLKKKIKGLDITGLEKEAKDLQNTLNDPDKVEDAKRLFTALEEKIANSKRPQKSEPAVTSQKEPVGAEQPPALDASKKKGGSLLEVIKRLTLARKSFAEKNFPLARSLYKEIMDLDPSNDEAQFYIGKIDQLAPDLATKVEEEPEAPETVSQTPASSSESNTEEPTLKSDESKETGEPDVPVRVMMPKRVLAPKIRSSTSQPEVRTPLQNPSEPGMKETSSQIQAPSVTEKSHENTPHEHEEGTGAEEKKTIGALNLEDEDMSDEFLKGIESEPFLKDEILDDLAGTIEKKTESNPPGPAPGEAKETLVKLSPLEMEKLEARAFNQIINRSYEKAIDLYDQILRSDPNFKDIAAKKEDCQKKLRESKGSTPAGTGAHPKPVPKKPVPVRKKPIKKT